MLWKKAGFTFYIFIKHYELIMCCITHKSKLKIIVVLVSTQEFNQMNKRKEV